MFSIQRIENAKYRCGSSKDIRVIYLKILDKA